MCSNIKLIAIDEKTLAAYGDIKTWNRKLPTRLVETLNQDAAYKPTVIAFDILYISEVEEERDFKGISGTFCIYGKYV